MKHFILIAVLSFGFITLSAQKQTKDFQFALITDTHIGSPDSEEDLRRTVKDINRNDSLSFVIISGDVTEFGADDELTLAKQIIDSLNKPCYVIPGNHDTKWSESGGNSFRRIFGSETFSFRFNDFLFIGTNSGPNMRMGPGQIPIENIVWLDSLFKAQKEKDLPIIYVNHYPAAEDINNWYEIIDRLKTRNIQLTLCGHGHTNEQLSSEGIPGIMGRSNLRAKESTGGYNIIHIYGDTLFTGSVRLPALKTLPAWATVKLFDHHFSDSTNVYSRADFSMNASYPFVKEVWYVREKSDIGSGAAISGNKLIATSTGGFINAYDINHGKLLWQFNTGAKIYSTPVVAKNIVIETATNGILFALDIATGKLLWKFDTKEPVVASPIVFNDHVFIAGSWGKCYSVGLTSGKLIWSNNEIEGFVETIPLTYRGMILFGTWGNHFYALDFKTGKIRWDWNDGHTNRMLSPAACVPVAFNNKLYFVAPDRKMTCLDTETGNIIWQSKFGDKTVRESMGVSNDSTLLYVKTLDGDIFGVSTLLSEGKIAWSTNFNIGYDITPSIITEAYGIVFVPTDKGIIYAFERQTGNLLWTHRISSCLINQILPSGNNSIICSSMDGVITKLTFPLQTDKK